jgi:hypothetical protein
VSVDLNAYVMSPEPIPAEALVSRLRDRGWAAAFVDYASLAPLPGTTVQDCLAISWRAGCAAEGAIIKALAEQNQSELDRLYAENELTSCSLTLVTRKDFAEALEDPRLQKELGRFGVRAALEQARLCYSTSSSAGRNRDSTHWQELLCLAIASLSGGVYEDPQIGTFELVAASSAVPDPTPPPRWRVVQVRARLALGSIRIWLGRFRWLGPGLVALGLVVLLGATNSAIRWYRTRPIGGRLEQLYGVTRAIRKGMPREEVLRLVEQSPRPDLEVGGFPSGNITLEVHYSVADRCATAIAFREGVVERTLTIGSRGRCPGAPDGACQSP